jgi:hypothetical protein
VLLVAHGGFEKPARGAGGVREGGVPGNKFAGQLPVARGVLRGVNKSPLREHRCNIALVLVEFGEGVGGVSGVLRRKFAGSLNPNFEAGQGDSWHSQAGSLFLHHGPGQRPKSRCQRSRLWGQGLCDP